jgi:hypothetical protein
MSPAPLSSTMVAITLIQPNAAGIDLAGPFDWTGAGVPSLEPYGNVIEQVSFEAGGYPYLMRADYAAANTFLGITTSDDIGLGVIGSVLFTVNAFQNTLAWGTFGGVTDQTGRNNVLRAPSPAGGGVIAAATFAQPIQCAIPALYNNQTSGQTAYQLQITPTYKQTGTAGATDLLVNRNEVNGVGSGAQNLMDLQVGGTSQFKVDRLGSATFKSQVWHSSDDGQQRLFFENTGNSYYKTHSGHVFRNVSDVAMMTIGSDGRRYCGAPNTAPSASIFWLRRSVSGSIRPAIT